MYFRVLHSRRPLYRPRVYYTPIFLVSVCESNNFLLLNCKQWRKIKKFYQTTPRARTRKRAIKHNKTIFSLLTFCLYCFFATFFIFLFFFFSFLSILKIGSFPQLFPHLFTQGFQQFSHKAHFLGATKRAQRPPTLTKCLQKFYSFFTFTFT